MLQFEAMYGLSRTVRAVSTTIFQILSGIAASQGWPEGDEFIHRIHTSHSPQIAADFYQLADSILSLAEEPECISAIASRVFRMNAWAITDGPLPSDWQAQIQVPATCQLSSARYHMLVGTMHYKSKNWVDASSSFEQAIQLCRDSVFLMEAYNNLSAAFEKIPNRQMDAIPAIETALRYAKRSDSPFLLNNIIALNIQLGKWDRAAEFAARLPDDLSAFPNNLQFNLLLNRLTLALRLNAEDASVNLFDELNALPVTPGNECEFARLTSKFLLIKNAYDLYRLNFYKFQELIANCHDESSIVQTEGLLY